MSSSRGFRGMGGDKDLAAYLRKITKMDGVKVERTSKHLAIYVDGNCVYTCGTTSHGGSSMSAIKAKVNAALYKGGKLEKKGIKQ